MMMFFLAQWQAERLAGGFADPELNPAPARGGSDDGWGAPTHAESLSGT